MTNESEFGKGLTYCLGLFLAHAGRYESLSKALKDTSLRPVEMWFNGSSDHLYELEIPETLPKSLQKRLKEFSDKCLKWGHGFPKKKSTEEDLFWSLTEAKELLRLIDKHFKVQTIKASFD